MPRQREFDIDTALGRAMETFWTRGYEATSVDDLCTAMALSRSSLYATFGAKDDLFVAALSRYTRGAEARVRRHFETAGPIRPAVERFLLDFVDEAVAAGPRRGCFIGNSLAELGAGESPAAELAREALERIERVFEQAFRRARRAGELPADANPRALARHLTVTVQGLRLVAKSRPDRRALEDAVAGALRAFD